MYNALVGEYPNKAYESDHLKLNLKLEAGVVGYLVSHRLGLEQEQNY